MKLKRKVLLTAVLSALTAPAAMADTQFTVIQTGDFHGHLAPRPNLRGTKDYDGQMVGGLARVAAKIKEIQAGKGGAGNSLLLHTGDTIQGSGEALYTKGQAIVDVVDMLGIDNYAPGNWDYVYGKDRFVELFANDMNSLPAQANGNANGKKFQKRWGGLASNLYYTSKQGNAPIDPTASSTDMGSNLTASEYDTYASWYMQNGDRVLSPTEMHTINGVKVGVVGCTTSRGPQVVGKWVTGGLEFTDCSREIPFFAKQLRDNGAEVVVLISEIEIGRNIQNIKNIDAGAHIDLVLNADMHEEPLKPIKVKDKTGAETWILEAGQDGTLINEITLSVNAGQVDINSIAHTAHRIDDRIAEDTAVANKVAQVRAPFNEAFDSTIPCSTTSPYVNPLTVLGLTNPTEVTCLKGPLSEVVGSTDVALHRSNYSHENMPAVIEGTSHDFIADAMRWWAKSDLAAVRGFRYGTHVAPNGDITRNDLYHFVPIGPRVGKVSRISANQLRNQVDNSSLAVFSTDPNNPVTPRPNYNNAAYAPGGTKAGQSPGADLPAYGGSGNALGWGGGWLFAYSGDGFHMNFDPYFTPSWQKLRSGDPLAASNKNAQGNTISGIYLDTTGGNNGQYANPPSDTSRARSLTVKMPCKSLPPAEIASTGCSVADTTSRYVTTITLEKDGSYSDSWKKAYKVADINADYSTTTNNSGTWTDSNATNDCQEKVPADPGKTSCGYTPYLLNPAGPLGWTYLQGTPNQPNTTFTVNQHFKAPLFTVAGYFYRQSDYTVNNCNNCYPMGTTQTVGDPNAAYLLPVNVDENGKAALDGNGNPKFVRDSNNKVVMVNGKPQIEGSPIELTEIIEKYLASFTGNRVGSSDLPQNRIGLVETTYTNGTPSGTIPAQLPDFTGTLGFPVMQPLCGTIGKGNQAGNGAGAAAGCPQ